MVAVEVIRYEGKFQTYFEGKANRLADRLDVGCKRKKKKSQSAVQFCIEWGHRVLREWGHRVLR